MNIKELISSLGDLSLSHLLICQVCNQYYKSSDYKKNKVGVSAPILKAKDSILSTYSDLKLDFLLRQLSEISVLTPLGHPGTNFEMLTKKAGVKSAPIERNFDKPALERQVDFTNEVMQYKNKYPEWILSGFLNWWGAIDRNTQRMLFEDTPYFETGRRLATWAGKRLKEQQQDDNSTLPGRF